MQERKEFYDLYCKNMKKDKDDDSSDQDGHCYDNETYKQFLISEEFG